MKKTARLFILLILMAGSQAMAQQTATPTFSQATVTPTVPQGTAIPAVQATPQKTPGMPLVYFSVGAGTALVGNGFGTEGNPWVDTNTDTLANGYGTSFNPGESIVALAGFNLDKNWSVNLSFESYSFITILSNASDEESLIPSLRYTFNSGWISPYVTAGLGLSFNTTSAAAPASVLNNSQALYNTEVVSNVVAGGGAGLLFKIGGDIGHAYIAAQCQQVFTSTGGFSYYPINVGVQYP
jgi:hypothetical protein